MRIRCQQARLAGAPPSPAALRTLPYTGDQPIRPLINEQGATTLEWTVPSPPPFDNFSGKHPQVYHGPYEFSVPGAAKDYVMQTSPEKIGD